MWWVAGDESEGDLLHLYIAQQRRSGAPEGRHVQCASKQEHPPFAGRKKGLGGKHHVSCLFVGKCVKRGDCSGVFGLDRKQA